MQQDITAVPEPPSTPSIILTTPTPSLPPFPTLSSPDISTVGQYDAYTYTWPSGDSQADVKQEQAYGHGHGPARGDATMNSFGSPDDVDVDVGVSLDMEGLHDFGEGVGVDMRDFDHGKVELVEHDMTTPHMHQGTMNPHNANSSMSNGLHETPGTVNVDDMFQTETGLDGDDDDDDDGEDLPPQSPPLDCRDGADETDEPGSKKRSKHNDVPGGFTFVDKDGESGRRKIRIEYITDKSRRHITFSKRKAGIMKKAYELSILTGTQVLLLVVSETGLVYTFTTTKLQPLVQKPEGKNLIQACLNAPDGFGPDGQPLVGPVSATKAKNGGLAIRPHKLTAAASAAMAASAQAAAASAPDSAMGPSGTPGDQQASAAEAIGQGTPVSARPKKRLPSGKAKKGSSSGAGNASSSELLPQSSADIPPVPPIPDMHRQPSPHTMSLALQSPLNVSAGYPYPPPHHQHPHHPHTDYHHQQHPHAHHLSPNNGGGGPSPTQPTFGYPPAGDYAYYPPPPPHSAQQGYLGLGTPGLQSPYGHTGPGHPGQGHSPAGQHRDGDRRMMGMGM